MIGKEIEFEHINYYYDHDGLRTTKNSIHKGIILDKVFVSEQFNNSTLTKYLVAQKDGKEHLCLISPEQIIKLL